MNRRGILAGIIALTLTTGTAAFAAETAPAAPASLAAEVAQAPVVTAAAPALAAPATAPAAATPLAPRATKPLTLVPKEESTPFGYKLLAGLGIAAAAGLWLHKKKKDAAGGEKKKPTARIEILSRKSVGVRNELLVIDVEGTRLLVGMTPGAMQTLAVLEQPDSLTEVSDEIKAEAAERPVIQRLPEPAATPRAAFDAFQDEDADDDMPSPVSVIPSKPRATSSILALDQKVRSLLANRGAPMQQTQPTSSTVVPKRRRGNNPSKTTRIAGQAKGLLLAMSDDSETPARTGEM